MAYRISRERFDSLVEEALQRIPSKYRRRFKNVRILVEDFPSAEDAGRAGVARHNLLGLFSGAPYPAHGGFFDIPAPLPDSIILYQKNIETICNSEDQIIEEIRLTLVHEVGHYFGMSEEQLSEY
ncbi:MAG TPA: metallopeptidase family protein [Dissulfurispiraceae bacterium]|nr:metallopeptidase family protein [Dissulfurispiraceae bacterium]